MTITTLDIEHFVPTDDKKILDVRDLDKFRAGHIAFAKNLPIDEVGDKELQQAVGDNLQVFVLCGGGTKAQRAVERLEKLNPNLDIVHLTGGTRKAQVLGWQLVSD